MKKNNIRKARIASDLTQAQLSKMLGLKQAYVSHMESVDLKEQNPELKTLVRFADALGVSIDYLVGRSDIE